jgi:hypothetical protein
MPSRGCRSRCASSPSNQPPRIWQARFPRPSGATGGRGSSFPTKGASSPREPLSGPRCRPASFRRRRPERFHRDHRAVLEGAQGGPPASYVPTAHPRRTRGAHWLRCPALQLLQAAPRAPRRDARRGVLRAGRPPTSGGPHRHRGERDANPRLPRPSRSTPSIRSRPTESDQGSLIQVGPTARSPGR